MAEETASSSMELILLNETQWDTLRHSENAANKSMQKKKKN